MLFVKLPQPIDTMRDLPQAQEALNSGEGSGLSSGFIIRQLAQLQFIRLDTLILLKLQHPIFVMPQIRLVRVDWIGT